MSRKSDVFNKTWTLLPEDEEQTEEPTNVTQEKSPESNQLNKTTTKVNGLSITNSIGLKKDKMINRSFIIELSPYSRKFQENCQKTQNEFDNLFERFEHERFPSIQDESFETIEILL
jgi:hypothetical protein